MKTLKNAFLMLVAGLVMNLFASCGDSESQAEGKNSSTESSSDANPTESNSESSPTESNPESNPTESSSESSSSEGTGKITKQCSWCGKDFSGSGYWWNGQMCMESNDLSLDNVEYCSSRCGREDHAKNLPTN